MTEEDKQWRAAALFYWIATAVVTCGAGTLWGSGGAILATGLCMLAFVVKKTS